MFGTWIGDMAGVISAESENTLDFTDESHLSDAGIMATAIGSAIIRSREEQFRHEKDGKAFHSFVLQETEAFLKGKNCECKAAAYISPCGVAAVTILEAVLMARICAEAAGERPEAVREAEAVAGTAFLAKSISSKDDIRAFLSTYYFDPKTDQRYVTKAINCFLESADFEDAIRRAFKAGCTCDRSITAIAGALAWTFYCSEDSFRLIDEKKVQIIRKAENLIPKESLEIGREFYDVAGRRGGTFIRSGFCTPVISHNEEEDLLREGLPKISVSCPPDCFPFFSSFIQLLEHSRSSLLKRR